MFGQTTDFSILGNCFFQHPLNIINLNLPPHSQICKEPLNILL